MASPSDEPNAEQLRRRFYLVAFFVALSVDLFIAFSRGGGYQPTLFGLAIMITSAVFFLYSWMKERFRR